jgi:formate hydrogenlyase subunit 3/multisubunit Na+/H+ antiporter MnhD subunit
MTDLIRTFLFHGANLIWLMIVAPAAIGVAAWLLRRRPALQNLLLLLAVTANLAVAAGLCFSGEYQKIFPFASQGMDVALRVYGLSSMALVLTAAMFLSIGVYGVFFLKAKIFSGQLAFCMLLGLGLANGIFLSDNLNILLFFWEGLLGLLFITLLAGSGRNPKTAVKALTLAGVSNLVLMLGVVITVWQAGTPYITDIQKLPATGAAGIGFACMMLGAAGMAGALPFHSWIPDAAEDSPAPVLLVFPCVLGVVPGIYLAARLVLDLYDLRPGSGLSAAVMILGGLTAVLAAVMMLAQKDLKRLLMVHLVFQTGLILLCIGTALPEGAAVALILMVSGVVCKNILVMLAGHFVRAESPAGTGDPSPGVPPGNAGAGKLVPAIVLSAAALLSGAAAGWLASGVIISAAGISGDHVGWRQLAVFIGLPALSLILPAGAFLDSLRKSGTAAGAADSRIRLPGLGRLFQAVENRRFDPYELLMRGVGAFASACGTIERGVSWFYDTALVKTAKEAGNVLHRFSNGSLSRYLGLAAAGLLGIIIIVLIYLGM